jgi:cytochrome b561
VKAHTLLGIALLSTSLVELVLAFFVVGPRIPDEGKRRAVTMAVAGAGVLMALLGGLLLAGVLGPGDA